MIYLDSISSMIGSVKVSCFFFPPNWGVSRSMEIDDGGISLDDLIVGPGNNIDYTSSSNIPTMTASMKHFGDEIGWQIFLICLSVGSG